MITITTDSEKTIKRLHSFNSGSSEQIITALEKIKNTVITDGDNGLIDLTKTFDKVDVPYQLTVSKEDIKKAYDQIPQSFIAAAKVAIKNISAFHQRQKPTNDPNHTAAYFETSKDPIKSAIRYTPVDSAGLYVPGGRAPLPSTVLMNAIPAKVAGVKSLVITTPPRPDGSVSPQILVAADLCECDAIYKVGGSQAIFAMTYGTETIPKVDKIVGPGNVYVTAAKKMVFGEVGIDKLAGPSEVLVIIDDSRHAKAAAIEMLAQLEHDPLSVAITVSDNKDVLEAIQVELNAIFPTCSRQDILKQSIKNGALLLANDTQHMIDLSNLYAPEHLVVMSDKSSAYIDHIKHAGSVFLGPYTPVALGDFYAGPNHVLPTSGTSRFSSPLGVTDFMKYSSFLEYSKEALSSSASDLDALINMEGLDAHLKSIQLRLD